MRALVLLGLLLLISPAQAQTACDQQANAPAGFTTIIAVVPAGVPTAKILVCGYTVSAAAASVVTFTYGTGTNCVTGPTAVGPTVQLSSTVPTFSDTSPFYRGFGLPAGQTLCATATSASNLTIYYTLR